MDHRKSVTGNLVLSELSKMRFPRIKSFISTKTIDLQGVKNIDSAGVAYLAQIKTTYSGLQFINIPDQISVLAGLYGVGFLFTE